jgi:hypothetical protein
MCCRAIGTDVVSGLEGRMRKANSEIQACELRGNYATDWKGATGKREKITSVSRIQKEISIVQQVAEVSARKVYLSLNAAREITCNGNRYPTMVRRSREANRGRCIYKKDKATRVVGV